MELKKTDDILKRILENNRLSHAYLFETNNNSSGKEIALEFAKNILLKNNTFSKDELEALLENDSMPDLKIIRPEGTMIKKEQLMELQKEFNNKSVMNSKRIYIIYEVDKLNVSSANSILKFLEEPNDDIVAILVTYNRYKALPTILSRCQIISLENEKQDLNVSDACKQMTYHILEKKNLFLSQNLILNELMVDKQAAKAILKEVELFLFDLYNQKLNDIESFVVDEKNITLTDKKEENILQYISIIEENLKKMTYNINYKLWLDSFLIELMEV